jgi:hypothetical protein
LDKDFATVVDAEYVTQILEGDLDDAVVPDMLRGSLRVKYLEPLRLKFVASNAFQPNRTWGLLGQYRIAE